MTSAGKAGGSIGRHPRCSMGRRRLSCLYYSVTWLRAGDDRRVRGQRIRDNVPASSIRFRVEVMTPCS